MGKHRKVRMRKAVKIASSFEERVCDLAADHGITVRVNKVRCCTGNVVTHHWLFDDERGRVLDYWSGTGRYWSRRTGEKGTVADPFLALDVAARISAGATR